MNRRELFRGIVGVGAGLVLPASLEENAETARRWWALGRITPSNQIYLRDHGTAPIVLVESAMGVTKLDAAFLYGEGVYVIKDEIMTHAKWLRDQGARDLMLNNLRWRQ